MEQINIVPSKGRFLTDKEMQMLFPPPTMNEVRGIVKLKFSHLLELAARTRIRVERCKFIGDTDIYLFVENCGERFIVGELVYQCLQRYQYPNTYDYAWFIAWMNGLDRPYVSMG